MKTDFMKYLLCSKILYEKKSSPVLSPQMKEFGFKKKTADTTHISNTIYRTQLHREKYKLWIHDDEHKGTNKKSHGRSWRTSDAKKAHGNGGFVDLGCRFVEDNVKGGLGIRQMGQFNQALLGKRLSSV